MKKRVRLPKKAIDNLKITYHTDFIKRVKKLEGIEEYSLSIIIYWNRLEATLKSLNYQKNIEKDYPDKLNFINKNWLVLKRAHEENQSYYQIVFGKAGNKDDGCLWKTRDLIAHANHIITKEDYEKYKDASVWMTGNLLANLPSSYDDAHRDFLMKKKSKTKNKRRV